MTRQSGRAIFGLRVLTEMEFRERVRSTCIADANSMLSEVTDSRWARVFSEAGIPAKTQPNMQSWLRTHAVIIVAMVSAAHRARRNGHGVSRSEAAAVARALREGLSVVRRLGDDLTPRALAALACLPISVLAALVWALMRIPVVVATNAMAPTREPAFLIDEMISLAPADTPRAAGHPRPVRMTENYRALA